ncbi:unnamed protein product [Acanthoscelides obtectus]|uniref:Pre-rRNA-processing protein RIX1 N-terminal domain-containing protein n=1 Tax=Acanthoscelides obtectus TaxID=200917 RepID=A0A9P0K2B6_ACAOB|nr:unnamed protein product [Acanthoscelides obtectus]CAK1623830.1 Proline-, glutamic acid- and leucine-rich protein 1 [Acanthoscelides obtectus]
MPLQNTQVEEALSSNDEVIKGVLSHILNLNIHQESNDKTIISSLNKLISTSKTRLQGLEILHLIIHHCTPSVITENALHWLSHCIVKHPGDDLAEAKLVTIGLIVKYATTDQDFTKKFITDHISKVLDMCISAKSNPYEIAAALETLTICMKNYPVWFTQHKGRIEKYLETFLDCTDKDMLVKAAQCCHYLQQVGNAGIDGITHRMNFSTTFTKLCVTAHKLLDDFFENESEMEHYNIPVEEHFEYLELHLDSQKVLQVTANRITNCLQFLKTMLLEGYPVAKEIKPLELLNLVKRGCAIHKCASANRENSLDDYIFSVLLTNIQVKLLQLLRIFIFWGQSNLFPYSFMVTKVLVDAFNRNQSCNCFKQNQVYQETVFKVLKYWFQVSKCSVKPQLQEQIIIGIISEIEPAKSTISLSINTEINQMKSKKARRKAVLESVLGNNKKHNVITQGERDIGTNSCNIALDLLTQILESSVLSVKPTLVQVRLTITSIFLSSLLFPSYFSYFIQHTTFIEIQAVG